LDINIQCIIANRDNLKDLVERFNIPFHYINADNLDRIEHENKMIEVSIIIAIKLYIIHDWNF
jgi:formyltetrahydrofolate deformylase